MLVCSYFWWPLLDEIKNKKYVKQCDSCQLNQNVPECTPTKP